MTALNIRRLDAPKPDPGLGVFETMLVVNGDLVEYDEHVGRLRSSVASLYGHSLSTDPGPVGRSVRWSELARVRLSVIPHPDGVSVKVHVDGVASGLVLPRESNGVELVPVCVPLGLGQHKWSDRRLVDQAEAEVSPALPLLIDADGQVLECSRANFFCVRGSMLHTPPAGGRILPGVTRARVIQLAAELGIPTREDGIALKDLSAAEEAFVTGAVRGIEPVRRLAGTHAWKEGEVARRLSARLRELWL